MEITKIPRFTLNSSKKQMTHIYFVLTIGIIIFWFRNRVKTRLRKMTMLKSVVIRNGRIVEKKYKREGGKAFKVKGRWKL